jgi:hypothetical protein
MWTMQVILNVSDSISNENNVIDKNYYAPFIVSLTDVDF